MNRTTMISPSRVMLAAVLALLACFALGTVTANNADAAKKKAKPAKVTVSVATDIGGGSSYSMLRTMDEAYKIQQLLGERLNPLESYWLMTRGNAEAVKLADQIGSLDPGTDADLVVLNARATPAMVLKMEVVSSLAEELFLMQTLGDDRVIAETYVAGKPMKSALA